MAYKKKVKQKQTPTLDYRKLFTIDIQGMSTGILPLDIILSGEGFIKGDVIEFASESSLGKSTTLLHMVKNLLDQGQRVLYIDVERGVKRAILDALNFSVEPSFELGSQFTLLTPTTYEEVRQILSDCRKQKIQYDIMITDSATALQPTGFEDMSYEDRLKLKAIKARYEAMFFSDIKVFGRTYETTVFFVSQTRTKLNFVGPCTVEAAGGAAVKFYPDVRLMFYRKAYLTVEEETVSGNVKESIIGAEVEIVAKKNRNSRSLVPVPAFILFGKGISSVMTLQKIYKNKGAFLVQGAKNTLFPGEEKEISMQGKKKAFLYFKKNYEELKNIAKERGYLDLVSKDEDVTEIEDEIDD